MAPGNRGRGRSSRRPVTLVEPEVFEYIMDSPEISLSDTVPTITSNTVDLSCIPILTKTVKDWLIFFHGGPAPWIACFWLDSLTDTFEYISCTEVEKVELAVYHLCDQAIMWWEILKTIFEERDLSWSSFREAFKRQYFSAAFCQERRQEFLSLKKGDRSFTHGLADIRQRMSDFSIRTYKEAVDWALFMEMSLHQMEHERVAEKLKGLNSQLSGQKRPAQGSRIWLSWSLLTLQLLEDILHSSDRRGHRGPEPLSSNDFYHLSHRYIYHRRGTMSYIDNISGHQQFRDAIFFTALSVSSVSAIYVISSFLSQRSITRQCRCSNRHQHRFLTRQVWFTSEVILDTVSVSKAPYRMTSKELEERKFQLQELLDRGFIVLEKDGSTRLCIDYHQLNTFRVQDEDVQKAVFRTRYKYYEFLMILIGLTNSSSHIYKSDEPDFLGVSEGLWLHH
ncbi:uncharacterized protein LOC141819426 [Curcuma longa]|uniref:uncharacterized protein LOC141819426 n=1 Tax=Curcuma longa TaxID=136217 RepID=UPI003D9DE43B